MSDNIEINPNKQYTFAVDISGSMTAEDCNGVNRYQYALEQLQSFIKASEDFDPDGPTVITFGETVKVYENTNLEKVSSVLSNPTFEGWTQTADAINKAWELHQSQKQAQGSHPGTVVMVITDGQPTNRKAVENAIKNISNSIEKDEEFSIIFLTVGKIDSDLQNWLTDLDDDLKGAKFDIVDVKTLESVTFLKAVAGAIND